MARGENPGELLSIAALQTGATAIPYDRNVAYGNANGGKDLAISIIETGTNEGQAQLAADGDRILGKLVEAHPDGTVTYMPVGYPILFRKTAADIVHGQAIRGGGDGKVKSDTTGAARGRVVKVLEAGDNGRILVLFP